MTPKPDQQAHTPARTTAWRTSPAESARTADLTPRLRLRWLAALLAATWLACLALDQLRLGVVIPLLLLVAVASVLRSGTNLVDRLVLAACLLAGLVLSAGLLFSVWPWRLAPGPVGGTLGSLVVLTAWLTRRGPRLPNRLLGSDLVVAGSGIFAFLAAYAPVAGLSAVQRFRFDTRTTDRFTHFSIFDTIHRLGGYAFQNQYRARFSLEPPFRASYPAGSHFLFALFDTALRSSANPGAALPEFNRYFVYVLAAYAFLVMALVWAARWIAGPRVAGWRRFVVCSAVAALAIGGPLVQLVEFGLDSDLLGLAFLALAVAVAARPPRVVREQVLICGALLIAVAYTYSLFAPLAVLCMGVAAVVYRRRLRGHWRFAVVTVAVCGAIACVPSAAGLASGFSAGAQALAVTGWVVALPQRLLAALGLLVLAAVASPVSRRLPASRAMAAQLVLAGVAIGAFGAYQIGEAGRTLYYFNKMLLAGYVFGIVGVGALGGFLRPAHARARPDGHPSLLREGRLAVAAAAVAMCLVTLFQSGITSGHPQIWAGSRLAGWSAGKDVSFDSASLITLAGRHLLGDGVPTIVLGGSLGADWYDDNFAAVVNRDRGAMTGSLDTVLTTWKRVKRAPVDTRAKELAEARQVLGQAEFPLRFVVRDRFVAAGIAAMLAARPGSGATVLLLS